VANPPWTGLATRRRTVRVLEMEVAELSYSSPPQTAI